MTLGSPCDSVDKEPTCSVGDVFNSWVEKTPWRREWLPTLAFWPWKFHRHIVHGATKSQTWLSNFHFCFHGFMTPYRIYIFNQAEQQQPSQLWSVVESYNNGSQGIMSPCVHTAIDKWEANIGKKPGPQSQTHEED